MGRLNKAGVRGLICESVTDQATGEVTKRYSMDLRYRDATGKPQRYRERMPDGVTAAAAKTRAHKVNNAATAGTLSSEQGERKKLGEALDAIEKWAEVNRPASLSSRKTQVKALKAVLGENTLLDELSPFAVERFKNVRSKTVGPAAINRGLSCLKHASLLFVEWGWMRESVALALRKVRKLKEPEGRVRVLSPIEEKLLLAKLPKQVIQIVGAATLTGLRRTEIATLKKTSVDMAAREITVVKSKSGKVRRVPIHDDLAPLLDAAMKQSTSEYVFTNRRGLPYHPDSITHAFTRTCRKVDIVDLHFHDCRHTFATWVRRSGGDLDALQALLGHATISMTQRYAHIGQTELHAAVARIGSNRIAQYNGNEPERTGHKQESLHVVK